MNLEHLTVEEIVQYVEAGVVDSIPAFVVLKLADEIHDLNQTIKNMSEEENYDDGWNDALEQIVDKARMMQC